MKDEGEPKRLPRRAPRTRRGTTKHTKITKRTVSMHFWVRLVVNLVGIPLRTRGERLRSKDEP